MKNICVVIVTFNRIEDLKKTLLDYDAQTYLPSDMIIVNNASSDGTAEYLDNWEKQKGKYKKHVIHNKENVGGAGGFSIGISKALQTENDFIFLADDDAFPENDMLEQLIRISTEAGNKTSIAALCTTVNDQFGISKVHRARVKKGLLFIRRKAINDKEYEKDYFDVDLLTFVGALIKRETIEKIGLPISEYFIHEDDAEYSTRIRKIGRIICVPSSKMFHLYGGNNTKDWIEYYTTRNYVDYIGRHYGRRYQIAAEVEKYIKKCSIIAKVIKKRSINYRNMNKKAIIDGRNGNLGISNDYKPGQEIG